MFVLTAGHDCICCLPAKKEVAVDKAFASERRMRQGKQTCPALLFRSNDLPVQTSALGVVFPSLLLIYLGQAAYLTQNTSSYASLYYSSIPTPVYWPMFVLALLASLVASQSIITGAAPAQPVRLACRVVLQAGALRQTGHACAIPASTDPVPGQSQLPSHSIPMSPLESQSAAKPGFQADHTGATQICSVNCCACRDLLHNLTVHDAELLPARAHCAHIDQGVRPGLHS